MTTPLRRFAGRAAAGALATAAITGAAVAGASAALPASDGKVPACNSNPAARALDFALSLRSGLSPDHNPTC